MMIIYDGEKYACVSCIRGHRSSTCRHTNRMLVKVRNRGRHASLDIRKVIIVDTESQVTPDDGSPSCETCCESNGEGRECDKMNKQPILFLRTIKMQRAILVDGILQIIVDEKDSQLEGSGTDKPSFKYVSEKEFLRQNSIQMSGNNIRPSCSCSGNESVRKTTDGLKTSPKIESGNEISWKKPWSHGTTGKPLNGEDEDLSNSTALDGQLCCKNSNNLTIDAQANPNSMVELFTHRGIYLSTQCSCEDDNCICSNCLLHRNEEELNSYIQRSGVPLTNLGEAQLANLPVNRSNDCRCSAEECQCDQCLEHPTEIISFNKFVVFGILNVPLRRKTIINFKGKLIPSQYWWDFLKLQVPLMPEMQLDSLDILTWFEKIASTYNSQLVDADNFHVDVTQAFFNV